MHNDRVSLTKGPKYINYRVFRSSIFGIVSMVLGSYLLVRYLDP